MKQAKTNLWNDVFVISRSYRLPIILPPNNLSVIYNGRVFMLNFFPHQKETFLIFNHIINTKPALYIRV
ncbi:hypothetical protein D9O36_13460 [Zobellia amurskyensis]|uniref:Uncharacterized protein n=1 Tax=Zobellia amurskyensis TaxID=248905 RepID=A0A7X2ZUY7_9FLAO|nr:hypothetical protein [Zobellia amurskyensis]